MLVFTRSTSATVVFKVTVLDSQLAEKETEALRSQRDEQLTTEREKFPFKAESCAFHTHAGVCVYVGCFVFVFGGEEDLSELQLCPQPPAHDTENIQL